MATSKNPEPTIVGVPVKPWRASTPGVESQAPAHDPVAGLNTFLPPALVHQAIALANAFIGSSLALPWKVKACGLFGLTPDHMTPLKGDKEYEQRIAAVANGLPPAAERAPLFIDFCNRDLAARILVLADDFLGHGRMGWARMLTQMFGLDLAVTGTTRAMLADLADKEWVDADPVARLTLCEAYMLRPLMVALQLLPPIVPKIESFFGTQNGDAA